MWTASIDTLDNGRLQKVHLYRENTGLLFRDVLQLWQDDAPFRTDFIALLADAPYAAYRWETPPIKADSVDRPFEFVLVDAPSLMRPPSPRAFEDELEHADSDGIATFPNLSGDALLIAPRPLEDHAAYGHLAAFSRNAPMDQQHALWKTVGTVMEASLQAAPRWLSTAGMGVPWLHIRVDRRPKYYHYAPYCRAG